jgi:hypothetical protein
MWSCFSIDLQKDEENGLNIEQVKNRLGGIE